jgi:hypothetical protein
VVIDTELKQSYLAQPGRQEWVTVIECISASGVSIPPYIIFKGENLVSTWIPPSPPPGWTFTTNASGWTNNFHGMNWIKHFDLHTKTRLSSSDEYRLLLCDGHDSHVSAALSAYCLQHRIVLCLLPPHSSHILQPLDVGIFAPLKMALSKRQARLFRSSVRRIEKVEWVEHYAEARQAAITEKNILSAWRGAGLFPENMVRVLHQLLDPSNDASTPITTAPISTSTPYLLTSSPPEPSTLRATNQAFLTDFASANVTEQHKIHVRRLSGITERLQTELTILKREVNEMKAIHGRRKERASGKRLILKGKTVISTEELQKALEEAEKATRTRKRSKTGKRKSPRSDSEQEDCGSETGTQETLKDSQEPADAEILDCIEVAL